MYEDMRFASRTIPLAALLLVGLLGCSGETASTGAGAKVPRGMTAVEADTLLKSYAKDRTDTEEWLKSAATSYLATVLRRDFEERASLTVGSALGNDVRIEDPGVKPRHLRVLRLWGFVPRGGPRSRGEVRGEGCRDEPR